MSRASRVFAPGLPGAWLRRVVFPVPVHCHCQGRLETSEGPVVWCGPESVSVSRPLLLSPGFGSWVHDYAALAELFGRRQMVYRVGHPGSDRRAALPAALSYLYGRWLMALSPVDAALRVRKALHRSAARERRLRQLVAAVAAVRRCQQDFVIDLAGHSFGTDTALLFALKYGREIAIDTLYLFSPHPPGYLIEQCEYKRLPVRKVLVITGSRDRTRDGVGPGDRLQVMSCLGQNARAVVLEEVAHMDFAFADLGPDGWLETLARELEL